MTSGKTGPRMQHILGRPRYAVVSAEENLAEDLNRLSACRDLGFHTVSAVSAMSSLRKP
jgi:hypothetical protein